MIEKRKEKDSAWIRRKRLRNISIFIEILTVQNQSMTIRAFVVEENRVPKQKESEANHY